VSRIIELVIMPRGGALGPSQLNQLHVQACTIRIPPLVVASSTKCVLAALIEPYRRRQAINTGEAGEMTGDRKGVCTGDKNGGPGETTGDENRRSG